MNRPRCLESVTLPLVLALAIFALVVTLGMREFAAAGPQAYSRATNWLTSMVVASAVAGFFIGTSLTRRRILRSMLKIGQVKGLTKKREASRAVSKRSEIVDYVFGDASDAFFANRSETRHFMSRDVQRVAPGDRVKDVTKLMAEEGVERVYVCDTAFRLQGIVTKGDLHQRRGTTAAEIMTEEPVIVTPEDSLQYTAGLMLSNNLSCLPVVMDDLLVGQIDTMDIIVTMECAFDVLQGLASELKEANA